MNPFFPRTACISITHATDGSISLSFNPWSDRAFSIPLAAAARNFSSSPIFYPQKCDRSRHRKEFPHRGRESSTSPKRGSVKALSPIPVGEAVIEDEVGSTEWLRKILKVRWLPESSNLTPQVISESGRYQGRPSIVTFGRCFSHCGKLEVSLFLISIFSNKIIKQQLL